MLQQMDHPAAFGLVSFLCLFVCAWGAGRLYALTRIKTRFEAHSESMAGLETSVLGLLALLLGFTFSMAVSRYDAHIETEVAEANAMSTVIAYLDTLPPDVHAQANMVMRDLVTARVHFSDVTTEAEMDQLADRSADLEGRLWKIANSVTTDNRDDVQGNLLGAISNLSDDMERRTAAVENRIPVLAWGLLLFIGCIGASITGMRLHARSPLVVGVLPMILAVTLMLVYDLDNPHTGLIQVKQTSMQRLSTLSAAAMKDGPTSDVAVTK